MSDTTLSVERSGSGMNGAGGEPPALGLVLLWSRDEPERLGEVTLVPSMAPGALSTLGRGEPSVGDPLPRLEWQRQRPGGVLPTGPLGSPHISRTQMRVEVLGPRALRLTNVGRAPLRHEGREVGSVVVAPGELVVLHRRALFLCVERPVELAPSSVPLVLHPFGEADAQGLVGESPVTWELRARIAFTAMRGAHVFVRGPSGAGKELVAQALHRLSARGNRPLVSRNAATFPETLIDAELFGNARGFPNPGMPERPGLVGEADGSTLFLDEFAELPQSLQTHLLRVLDAGEYTRLGESRPRRADFRLVAATNRPESSLKEDVLARLPLRLELSGLNARREDIPLLARHVLRRLARGDSQLASRFFPEADPSTSPRMSQELVAWLVRHDYTTHMRELEALLWRSISQSPGDTLELWAPETSRSSSPAVSLETSSPMPPAHAEVPERVVTAQPMLDPLSIPSEIIQACLDKHEGRQEPVWRELGLSSRHVLTRLVRRYNLKVRGRGGQD